MTSVINIASLSMADKSLLWSGKLPGHVYIGRRKLVTQGGGSFDWGSQYSHKPSMIPGVVHVRSRAEAINRHKMNVLSDRDMMTRIRRELRNKILVCWCKPNPCHGDTLALIANGGKSEQKE